MLQRNRVETSCLFMLCPDCKLHDTDKLSVSNCMLQVNITSAGLLGGWVSADPVNGTLGSGQSQMITVKYDVSQNEFQGMYEADILITTTGQPLAKAKLFPRILPSTKWFHFSSSDGNIQVIILSVYSLGAIVQLSCCCSRSHNRQGVYRDLHNIHLAALSHSRSHLMVACRSSKLRPTYSAPSCRLKPPAVLTQSQ